MKKNYSTEKNSVSAVFCHLRTIELKNTRITKIIMSTYSNLFGEQLLAKEGLISTSELEGKIVAIYFSYLSITVNLWISAHWCPPCRAFTPKLRQAYLNLQKEGKNFEVVFCSCDRSQPEFDEYFQTMPWKAIPFDRSDIREKISRDLGIMGIPALLLMDENGVYSREGRYHITNNPTGFPWK